MPMRAFLDHFCGWLDTSDALDSIATRPDAVESLRERACLAAVGEHLARRWNLPIPPRADDPGTFLKEPYFTSQFESLKALLLVESPIALRRLIFTEAEPLRCARMLRMPVAVQ